MIILYRSNIQTDEIKTILDQKLKHHFLDHYIEKPKVSEDKLAFLTHIVNHTNMTGDKKSKYIVSTMLVQVALDIHETVPVANNPEASDTEKTQDQLTVLAGDYYSGLYYLLLSEAEDVAMISLLATAIKEINELKMAYYYKNFHSFSQYINLLEQIDSLLIRRVADHVNNSIMGNVASDFIVTDRLIKERDLILNKATSQIVEDWSSITPTMSRQTLLRLIEETIDINIDKIETAISHYPFPFTVFQPYINHVKKQLVVENTSFVEER